MNSPVYLTKYLPDIGDLEMRFFRRYIFPGLYGLSVYFTVRILEDSISGSEFWRRPFSLNALEMGFSMFAGYFAIALFDRVLRYFDRKAGLRFDLKHISWEIFVLIFFHLIFLNLVFTPLAAFTDDGLSLADFIFINTIPNLFAVIYFGLRRSRQYLNKYLASKLQLEKITNNHLETELKFLKAQYHPHFLFNALNTIYFQMDDDIPGTKRNIEKFSDLLRYQLNDRNQKVPVCQEINYLQGFIEIQKLRRDEQLRLFTFFDENLHDQLIYPLLFLPLVENAFKHMGGKYNLDISARLHEDSICFRVENSIDKQNPGSRKSCGIGLENLQRRLELLYPGNHELNIVSGENFITELNIVYEKADPVPDCG